MRIVPGVIMLYFQAMRSGPLLLNLWIASAAVAQVPSNPYELATGKVTAKPADRAQALALLNKAKAPMRLLSPATPRYFLSVTFAATGDPANSGRGEFTELWLGSQSWRWTAKLGDFSVSRVHTEAGTFDEKPVTLLPMRVHMLRNAIFWAAQGVTASSQFRSAAAEWNGRPTTCLLISNQPEDSESPARRWNESEYCIDDQTGLLQILSIAPGSYTVYRYAAGQSFHGRPMPDRIETYLDGAVVIDASFRIDEASTAGNTPALTPEMIAAGPPIGLDEPFRTTLSLHGSGAIGSVMVNAQVGPDGKVVARELCVATDPSLVAPALNRVKLMEFGRSDVQRQAYIEARFSPESSPALTRPRASLPSLPLTSIEPYYLERTISIPSTRGDITGPTDTKEILARRSDGATLRMETARFDKTGQYVRHLKFPDGRSVTLYDSIKAKVTWPALGRGEIGMLSTMSGRPDCATGTNRTLLHHDQIEGVAVDVIQLTAGSYRITTSEAPKLGCQSLRVNSEAMNQDGSFRSSAETKTTRLLIGEPDARLFEIGPDLVEMKPSLAQRRFWDSLDLGLTAEERASVARELQREGAEADSRYEGKRQ